MIQEIATYLILLFTAIVAARHTLRFFNSQTDKCSGCAMSAAGCRIAGLKRKLHTDISASKSTTRIGQTVNQKFGHF